MATSGNKPERSSDVSNPLPPYFDTSSGGRYFYAKTLARNCALGNVAEVEKLLKSTKLSVGQALNVGGVPDGWSCLIFACRWLNSDVISYLIKKGSDLNFCTTGGMTPLMAVAVAAKPENPEKAIKCAVILADAGANLSHPLTFNRRTVLTMAVSKGATELVEFLLEIGANPNLRDDKGETAFNIAVAGNMMEAAELLVTYGANPFMKNLDGKGCRDLAAMILHPDAAEDMKCFLTRILNKIYREQYGNRQLLGDMLEQVNRECRSSRNNTVNPPKETPAPVVVDAEKEDSDEETTNGGDLTAYDETLVPALSYECNNSPWIRRGLTIFAVLSFAMFVMKK